MEQPQRRVSTALLAVGAIVGAGVLLSYMNSPQPVTSEFLSLSTSAPTLMCQTEYEYGSEKSLGSELSYKYVVQVQKINYLKLNTEESVIWKVNGVEQNDGEATTSISYFFDDIDSYFVEAGDHSFTVYSKIVRREIRDLTDADREAYFSALNIFYRIDEDEGISTYGESFENGNMILRRHLYGAADLECDHWHDDAGMLTHHIAVTWKFEQSLRLIDSSTASHYWDYTRDAASDAEWYDSSIFGDEYFGTTSPTNPDHVLAKGTFAYLSVKDHARDFSTITNPYGLLRSPWNTNNVPYLMRYNYTAGLLADGFSTFPTCESFVSAVGEDLGMITFLLNGALHGPVHLMVGGHWGVDLRLEAAIQSVIKSGSDVILLLAKDLWRQGIARVPTSCSSDTSTSECKASCPTDLIEEDMDPITFIERFGLTAVSQMIEPIVEVMEGYGMSNRDIVNTLCEFGYPGEMFSSAAPQDPIFWPLHGPAERFVQLLRLWKENGKIDFDESWGYYHASHVPSDTHRICDWSDVVGLELPTCSMGTCVGHRVDDLLPFEDLYDGQEGLLSNAELYSFIHPNNESMPYIYDDLDTWKGCHSTSFAESFEHYDGPTAVESLMIDRPMLFGGMQ